MDQAGLSSPDPLNDSPTFQSPPKPRRSSRVTRSLPLHGDSPKKQTFELDVGNQLSPQKIRVTVEAGDSDTENMPPYFLNDRSPSPRRAPATHRRERTTTTIVPVKGLSDSEDETQQVATPKRGRGRPKKSTGTPVPVRKRDGGSTPIRRASGRRRSIGSLVDGDDEEDVNFQVGKGVEVGRGKGRSRSRSRKGAPPKSTPASKKGELSDALASSTTSKRGRGRRKTLLPDEVVVLEDRSPVEVIESQVDGANLGGASGLRGVDSGYSPSAYSTIRSTVSIGGDEPDVVVARFHPENETPRQPGWSSPRFVEAPRSLDLNGRPYTYHHQSVSADKAGSIQRERESAELAPLAAPDQPDGDMDFNENGEENYADEEHDAVGDLREFDTILESEEFSMISVDSVPSLREHLSSPVIETEKQVSKPVETRNVVSSQQSEAASLDDSFSSIAEEVLKAATPAKKSLVAKVLSKNLRNNEDSFSSIASEILEAATPARGLPKSLPPTERQVDEDYEDSFSAIPSAVLDAATPAAERKGPSSSEKLAVPSYNRRISGSSRANSSPTRLLTPEETPSPPGEESKDDNANSETKESSPRHTRKAVQHAAANSSLEISHIASSPPSVSPRRYTYTAHLRQHRQLNPNLTQTPSIVFSSPSLPPPILPGRGQPSIESEQIQRPPLSPILRAGRVLQDVVVPSPTRTRSQSLGSPFKSPAAERKSTSSAAREACPSPLRDRPVGLLPKLDLNGELSGHSSIKSQWRGSHQEDPFRSTASTRESRSPEQSYQYSLDLPQQRRISDPRLVTLRSERESILSEDAMSWQAEDEISLPDNTNINAAAVDPAQNPSTETRLDGSANSLTWEQRAASEREAVKKQIAEANSSKVILIDSDDNKSDNEGYDDEFGLLLETLNSSSPCVQQHEDREPPKDAGRPRRSKIPSPWRNNSKRLVYNDEISSHLVASGRERAAQAKFFEKDITAQPVTVRRVSTPIDDTDPADLSGWQIPQKSNFKPRVREGGNLDLSLLLATSPSKPLPVLSTSSRNPSFRQDSSPSKEPSGKIMSSIPMNNKSRDTTGFTPIPQKAGFKPRPRVNLSSPVKDPSVDSALLFRHAEPDQNSSLLEPSPSLPVSQPLGPSSSERVNVTLHAPSAHLSSSEDNQSSYSFSYVNEEKENQNTIPQTLKWPSLSSASSSVQVPLPPPVSPTKSCLRSPLKTPSYGSGSGSISPSKGVTFVSSSPIPSSPAGEPLSSTTWSKDHWKLLDSILQTWKPDSESSPSSSGSGSEREGRKRRNSTRVISKLLGKNVSANGERMKLQQWHLEAVDEFRGYVPGWDEAVIAKRLFALIVGEEKRKSGLIRTGVEHST